MLQTFQPEHPVIHAILCGDEEQFWAAEAREREAAGVPPFGRMAGIIISAPEAQDAFDLAGQLVRHAGPLIEAGATVYGPAPAPISRIRGRHRVRLLVKSAKGVVLQAALRKWLGGVKVNNNIRLSVDIDPQSFL